MAQHRIMTILLFVYLSLCFEVAQSELKKDGDPCIYSDDCKNRCCHRDSPKGSGKCVQKSMRGVRCYGPNYGDPCFRSHQCNSGCCYPGSSVYKAFCVPKYDKTRKCLGPNFGDFCYSSDQCHSGCCHNLETIGNVPICLTKSEDHCFGAPVGGLYRHCPCESGLLCEKGTSRNTTYTMKDVGKMSAEDRIKVLLNNPNRRICKKPNTANN
ncbi:leucine-rich colipase-like protein 1 isoform X3 [Eleutherodactylus coqui]|uniref:leucine-rich colipase-like protein 1 isoform X3 n=1 Tax=Eleutherodactylus coqui TaxID=57060 RepID=UPI003461F236